MRAVPKNLFQLLALCILASLALGVWSTLSLRATLQSPRDEGTTSYAGVTDFTKLHLATQTLIASNRGFLITADPELKQQCERAMAEVADLLTRLAARSKNTDAFTNQLSDLQALWTHYEKLLRQGFELRRKGVSAAFMASYISNTLLPQTNKFQKTLSGLSSDVSTVHAESVRRTQALNIRFISLILTGTLASLVLLLWAYVLNSRRLSNLHQLSDETRHLLDTFFQFCPIGLTLMDRDFRYLRVNETLAETHGKSPQEHIGRTVQEVVPGVWDQVQTDLEKVVRTGESVSLEKKVEFPPGSGKFRYWIAGYFPVRDAQGAIKGVGNFASEITERRRLMENLKQSNAELERFAYVASHDLREPLRMIATYLGLLQRELSDRLTSTETEHLAYALDGAKRLNGMVSALLQFSRIGKEKLDLRPVGLNEVVNEVLANLQTSITDSSAFIDIQSLPTVVVDRTHVVQLFQNLISNALKFHQQGVNPKVQISAQSFGERCVVSVKDEGLGIATDEQESIFEIFRRLHRRAEYPGDGIGLAACKKIVEAHGGQIWVESQPQHGSTFHFTLLLKRDPTYGPCQTTHT